jgi:hypothetical protein
MRYADFLHRALDPVAVKPVTGKNPSSTGNRVKKTCALSGGSVISRSPNCSLRAS